jgi:hypothetical protein
MDTPNQSPLPFLMPSDFDHLDLVAWRVEQGEPDSSNPLLEPEMPWDVGGLFAHGTVLRDPIDGLWKAWHVSAPRSVPLGPGTWTHDARLTYIESQDGVVWSRPELSLVPWEGHEHTNLVMDLWCAYASVNVDVGRQWPYEMFVFRNPGYPGASGQIPGLPLPAGADRHPSGLYRFRSRDGKEWQPFDGPIELETSDSCFIYRQEDGTYVSYHKFEVPAFPGGVTPWDIGDGGVRLIGRRTSEEGSSWSDPTRLVLAPDWRDPADMQLMELCPIQVPGGYLATVTVYHNHTQQIDLQWAASRDGITWWRPDRRPALPNPPLGEWGGGMIWPMLAPVLDASRLHVYYSGAETLHGDLFNTATSGPRRLSAQGEHLNRQSSSLPDYGALCRANWEADRLWAMVTATGGPYLGTATTTGRPLGGKKLSVNVLTRGEGELRAELLDGSDQVLPGYSRDECKPVQGDHHRTLVTWADGEIAPDRAARIRFLLKRAFLYGFDTAS